MSKKRILSLGVVFLFVFFLLSIYSSLYAATKGKIAGRVTNKETGEVLMGANIIIVNTPIGASANNKGEYFIINVPPGTYSVSARFMGFAQLTKVDVHVYVGRTTQLNFELTPSVIEGEMVTITAERPVVVKDLTASERVLTTGDIEKTWARSFAEVMETQTGVFREHFRGGTKIETVYQLDNVSLNSGLMSDNYQGINTSALQEVAILTGGFNAEYGNAQSGVVSLVSKGAFEGIHGSVIARMRPAGKYHYGRNIYSKENYDWANHDLAYWTVQSQNPTSWWFGQNPNDLLNQWRTSITPDPIQSDYHKRAEWETEATFYGALTDKIGFLLSGRFKQGVGMYPQTNEYNPEYNLQGNLTYKLNPKMSLRLSGVYGGYESCEMTPSNYNTFENSQEIAWLPFPQIPHAYWWFKVNPQGAWHFWPELKKFRNYALKWTHVVNPKTFYEIDISYLYDNMDKTDREGVTSWDHTDPNAKWDFDDERFGMFGIFESEGYLHFDVWFKSQKISLRADVTSQVTKNNQVKAGFVLSTYDFQYEHVMSAYEGGERWNLCNIYDGKPYEGTLYVQDKLEFSGMVVNAGVRVDLFNQNRDTPKNMFDPLAFEESTPGNEVPWLPGNPEMEKTKLQVAFAPRLGISHPIRENTVLHFMYGHFYQRPSWHKMFGFPYINFDEDMSLVTDPYAQTYTYMDQWMGYQGNPKLGYERTIQYEVGVDQNIADMVRMDITGYYKDASRQTVLREGSYYDTRYGDQNVWTVIYNASNQYNIPLMISNCAFADIRGLEVVLDTRFKWPLNFNLSYDLSYTTGGVVGYATMFEEINGVKSGVDSPQGYAQQKKTWNNNQKFKGVANLALPRNFGPEILGSKPLSDVNVNLYFEYWNGLQYTYHGPDDPSTEPNNMRWFPHYRTNLKVSKGFHVDGVRSEISVEVRNLFNNKDLNMLFGDFLITYHNNPDLPLEERLPTHWWSGEPDEWTWYNMYTNPPRMVYVQLRVDF